MSATQAKIVGAAIVALLAWWLTPKVAPLPRIKRELDVDVNVNSPYFGMTDEEIAAAKAAGVNRANPALDPDMRRLIDASNILIDRHDMQTQTGETNE